MLIAHIMSKAFTKEVVIKGRIRVSHSQWVKMANKRAAVEARKTRNQRPRYFLVCSIAENFCKNKVRRGNDKNSFTGLLVFALPYRNRDGQKGSSQCQDPLQQHNHMVSGERSGGGRIPDPVQEVNIFNNITGPGNPLGDG